MHRKFDDLPWKGIVEAMGGHLGKVEPGAVHVGIFRNDRYQTLIISDNGGEVNVSEVVPHVPPGNDYQYSVPYDCSTRKTQPGALTLASWLNHRLDGTTPDYDLDLDKEQP